MVLLQLWQLVTSAQILIGESVYQLWLWSVPMVALRCVGVRKSSEAKGELQAELEEPAANKRVPHHISQPVEVREAV